MQFKKSFTTSDNDSGLFDKSLNDSQSGGNSKFIYYAKTEKFITQLEIYIKPTNYPDKKIVIMTKSQVDFKDLNSQIKDAFKSISDFKNISGLRVENLFKVYNEKRTYLPKTGCISEYLKSGDIIYCDIISDEYWIKIYFNILAYQYKKVVKLEYKLKKK